MVYSKRQPIDSISEGDRIDDIFVVKIKKGIQPYSKGFSFQLLLTDSSGRTIDYKYWGNVNEDVVKSVYESIKPDSVVYVQGKASKYNDKLQISTNEPDIIRALQKGEYSPEDFIIPAKMDVGEMYGLLMERISGVGDPELKKLLERIFNDPPTSEKFKTHPAAIEIHHNWTGGLLQHTLEVVEYALLSHRLFPDMNKDLLVAGSLLHDIGKLEELEVTSRVKGTRKGQLEGHISIGYAMVSEYMKELGTGVETREKLLHIILSHHGRLEYGSPKPPMTPEAFAVYYADDMSSKLSEITDYVKWAKDSTDDEFMYHKRHGYNILLD
ncbi:MAG: HD domain-containing protein [Candidatus Altiarchaeota archaeon]